MGARTGMGAAPFSNMGEYERKAPTRISNEEVKMQRRRDAKRGMLFNRKLPLDDGGTGRNAELGEAYSEKFSRKADQLGGAPRIHPVKADPIPLFYTA